MPAPASNSTRSVKVPPTSMPATMPLISDPDLGAELRRVGGEAGGGQGLGDAAVGDEGDAVGDGEGGVDALLDQDGRDAGRP